MPVRSKTLLVTLTLTLVGLASCSQTKPAATGEAGRAAELREIATILPLYSGEHKRGPQKASDLAPYEAGAPLGYRAVVTNEIVIVWGATMPGEGEGGGSEAVVAYEKNTPTSGGWVLLQNGKVLEMTADQFKAAPKVGQ
jgi:hypothetical protein